MDVAKARHLLELLRRRTVERGATAGEAAQAAVLAEKLIARFGLAGDAAEYSESIHMQQNRFPSWAETLANAMQRQGRSAGMKGPKLVRFRNRFLEAAAWSVFCRLNEKYVERLRLEYKADSESDPDPASPPCKSKTKPRTIEQMRMDSFDITASMAGYRTGDQVALSADVIGNEPEPLRLASPVASGGES